MFRSLAVAALLLLAGIAAASQIAAAVSPLAQAGRFYPGGDRAAGEMLAARLDGLTPGDAPAVLAAARQFLKRAPMSDVPLAVAGEAYRVSGDSRASDAALTALVARSPRNRMGRAWAAEQALKAGRFEAAIAHADALMALHPSARDAVLDWLVMVAADPQSHDAVRRHIAAQPPWADGFVRKLGAQAPDSTLTYDLNRAVPTAQSAYLSRLVGDGRFEEAFIAWLDFLPPGQGAFAWPYDGAFKGLPGAAPFNWSLDKESTEFAREGGLYSVFRGRRSGRLATQVMMLGAGDYRLDAVMDGELRSRGGAFKWTVTCLRDGAVIAQLDVRTLSEKPERFVRSFTITPACPVQRLALEGVSGELPLWAKARTHGLTITALDAEDAAAARAGPSPKASEGDQSSAAPRAQTRPSTP